MSERSAERTLGPTFTSLSHQVALHGRYRSQALALISPERSVTWGQLNGVANAIAVRLREQGVEKGERVSLLLDNSISSLELILGIWRAGAAVVPLSPMQTADVLAGMVSDSAAKHLICVAAYDELAKQVRSVCDVSIQLLDELTAELEPVAAADLPLLGADDLSNIIYSSGTTGIPKGIPHTHAARLAFAQTFATEFGFNRHSLALSVIPPHSNGAWLTWVPAFLVGAPTYLLPGFDVERYLAVVREYQPTHAFVVPTICAALSEAPGVSDGLLNCFECMLTAGAPMPAALKQTMMDATDDGLWELWGLTESVATVISPKEMRERPDSVGRPALGMDFRIIDAGDNDITGAGIGEIVGRSSSLMAMYWNREDELEKHLWQAATGECFLRTGDVGEFDNEGYLYLRGRAKDMIISGGLNVFPVDIEQVLLTHSSVKDACVVGIADQRWGETPVAHVLLDDEAAAVDTEVLRDWANERLGKHQRLKAVRIETEDFPRNLLGKVLKNELRDRWV